jgi:hypothetical protein
MNKPGYQPLTVLMQSESSGFVWAFTPGRSSPTVIALRILIALCALLPICAIAFASYTAGSSARKQPIPAPAQKAAQKQSATPTPAANADDRIAAADSDANRPGAIADKTQAVDQAPAAAALPVSETPSQAEPTGNNHAPAGLAPRVAGRLKLEKFRRELEKKRARLEKMYQAHAISAVAYKQGQEKYKGEIERYREKLNSAVNGQKDDSKF